MRVSGLARSVAIAVVALLVTATSVRAQITTGTVAGTVRDQQGGVIPGATVLLVNDGQGTRSAPIVTSSTGEFAFPNTAVGTYSIEVTMSGFKTLKRSGIVLSAGDRVNLGALTIEIGGVSQTIEVKAETPIVQTQTGERSFTVQTASVANLPISNRSFVQLASLAPGVAGTGTNPARLGGGGSNNVMMDGVSTMDTGSNSVLLQMTVESIEEVKVLTSSYQAEYGRSSGLQITATTKSGSNRFHGSFYDVDRSSKWNANSHTNILNGDSKPRVKERDWGFSIGGPVGKPGHTNKLFFFYSQEFAPRTAGGDRQVFRVPTALERQGDFSATTDNLGAAFPYIKDPLIAGTCSATNQTACFNFNGSLGKIDPARLYSLGLNILNLYPQPNHNVSGDAYNYEITRPIETALGWLPALRLDYQRSSKMRGTFKFSGWGMGNKTFNGSLPGFNDSKQQNPKVSTWAVTINRTLSPTTFLEGTYGHSQNELAGCALAQAGTGPTFCTSGFPMNDMANRVNAGLGNLPMLFPDALTINPDYYAVKALNMVNPPIWQNGQLLRIPNFTWGGRVANSPPNTPYPGYLNINSTNDISVSLTTVKSAHTLKMGFYNTHSYKAQNQGNPFGAITFTNDANNPLDTQFPFSNAAMGIFGSYQQQSKYIEGNYVYNNTEGYIQDNWRVNGKLTLDYGLRLVHQQPQYDGLGQASNFFPDKWTLGQAPTLYVDGCVVVVAPGTPCPTASRQAQNPLTGGFLGPNSTAAIGTLIAGTGSRTNGLIQSGQGITKTTYKWPMLALAPRFGAAYDVTGKQAIVIRGGMGLFFDRPDGNSVFGQVQNPPALRNVTVRNGQLASLGSAQFSVEGVPGLTVFEYDSGALPSSTQWNLETQIALPWATSASIGYVGQHSFQTLNSVNINGIDLGSAFLAQNQDATLGTTNTTPGANAVLTDQMRYFRGYGAINQQLSRGWRTFHSIQLAFNRRFRDGVSFGFNDTITLYDHSSTGARLQHNADGTYSERADQAQADELLGTAINQVHVLKGNFVWDMPDLKKTDSFWRYIGLAANDWQLSGIWTASTGTAYNVAFSYQNGGGNVNLTGSPDFGGRVLLIGDTGSGCSSNVLHQFNTDAFKGPALNSVGLESSNGYLRGCFLSVLDLALARNIPISGGRNIQLRLDVFNAPNAAIITGRNSSITLTSPTDPINPQNLPYDLTTGALIASRSIPRGAGFGVANAYQTARTAQFQVRFSF